MSKPTPIYTEELIESLKGTIAIVCNGPLDYKFGRFIDSHDTIIRINNFQIKDYEPYSGQQTTIWCTIALHYVKKPEVIGLPVICPFSGLCRESEFTHRVKDILLAQKRPYSKIRRPTTGFMLAKLITNLHKQVSIFGFAGQIGGHYWNSKDKSCHKNGKLELENLRRDNQALVYTRNKSNELLYDYCHLHHKDYKNNNNGTTNLSWAKKLPKSKILEFGSGNGQFSIELSKLGHVVTATDISRKICTQFPTLHLDAIGLASLDGTYDWGVSFDVLEHMCMNDINIALLQLNRLCKNVRFSVSTRQSYLTGPKGENLHKTVENHEWWINKLLVYFNATYVHKSKDNLLFTGKSRET